MDSNTGSSSSHESKEKTTLLDFPNEILYMVGDHLDEPSDVNSLCLTNKHFNAMFESVLVQKDAVRKGNALYWAAATGREDLAKRSLAAGAYVDQQVARTVDVVGVPLPVHMPTSMDTPLHAAARNGQTSMIRLLFANGAQPNLPNAFDCTPLHECDPNDTETLKLLIENGCKLNPGDETGCSRHTLIHAIMGGAREETLVFLCYGGATEGIDETLLVLQCAYYNNLTALKFFHERMVNIVDIQPPYRSPALAIAVEMGYLEMVKWMLSVGVELTTNMQSHIRERVFTSIIPLSYPVWKLLVDKGMNLETLCPHYKITLLMSTANSLMNAKTLLRLGANPNTPSLLEKPVLHYRAQLGHTDHVRLLLSYGADINIADRNGWNSLHFACVGGSLEIVRLLLDHGADMRASDKYGLRPLDLAYAPRANPDIKRLLLQRGANAPIRLGYYEVTAEMQEMIDNRERCLVQKPAKQTVF